MVFNVQILKLLIITTSYVIVVVLLLGCSKLVHTYTTTILKHVEISIQAPFHTVPIQKAMTMMMMVIINVAY